MFCRTTGRRLIDLAIHLTGIAFRFDAGTALRGLQAAPSGGRAAEPAPERARKRLCRTKAHRQRDVQHRGARLSRQPHGGDLDTPTAQVIAQRLAHSGREEAVEVERRKMRHRSQGFEVERLVQLPVDGFDHPVHSARVLRAAIARRHATHNDGWQMRLAGRRGLGRNVDVFDLTLRCRNGNAVFSQALNMKGDGLPDLGFDFRDCCTCSDTTRKVRDIGRIVAVCFFNDDGVAHRTSRFQTSLLEDAAQCAGCEIVAWLAGHCDATRLARVLELTMTSPGCNQCPAVALQRSQNLTDFHAVRIAGAR